MIFATVNNNILIHAGKILRVYEEPEEPPIAEKSLLFRFGNPDFDPNYGKRDNNIYTEYCNKYDEYIVIEYTGIDEETGEEVLIRQVERVGSWEVDLSGYAKNDDLNDLTQVVADNKAAVEQAIADEAARATAAEEANANEIAKKADKATTLEGYGITDAYTKEEANKKIEDALKNATGGESAADVKVALDNYKESNDERVDAIEEALEALEGAEPNFITSVDDANFSVNDGKLSLVEIKVD
jgi:hypothetical protein